MISVKRASTGAVRTGLRYFGHQTAWNVRLNTAPAFLAQRAPASSMRHYTTAAHLIQREGAHSPVGVRRQGNARHLYGLLGVKQNRHGALLPLRFLPVVA